MDFKTAISKVNENEKIIFGTRTKKWHIINSEDRDFNTSFSLTKEQADVLDERDAIAISCGMTVVWVK